jgi:hypothetical protein
MTLGAQLFTTACRESLIFANRSASIRLTGLKLTFETAASRIRHPSEYRVIYGTGRGGKSTRVRKKPSRPEDGCQLLPSKIPFFRTQGSRVFKPVKHDYSLDAGPDSTDGICF